MATIEELVLQLTANTEKLQAELKTAVNSTTKATSQMQKAMDQFATESTKKTGMFEAALSSMAGFLGSQVIIGAFNKAVDAAKFLGDQLLEGVKASQAEEAALSSLNNSLAANGNFSKKTAKDLSEFAEAMEQSTKFEKDAIQIGRAHV